MSKEPVSSQVLELFRECASTFVGKSLDYGSSYQLIGDTLDMWFPSGVWIDEPEEHAFHGIFVRMLEKMVRIKNLAYSKDVAAINEGVDDSLKDLATYALMAAQIARTVGVPDSGKCDGCDTCDTHPDEEETKPDTKISI